MGFINQDCGIHGIIVQLPLPRHLSETDICNAVHPSKVETISFLGSLLIAFLKVLEFLFASFH